MEFSITDYPNVIIYGLIFVLSIFLSETFKERASVMLFIVFFLSYPHSEYLFYSNLMEDKKPEDYYFFNVIWESCLLAFLLLINKKDRWARIIYIIQASAISLNILAYSLWHEYAEGVYYWYEILNRLLIESTILALISKDNKKGILFICFLLIAIPYASNLLF